MRRTYRPKKDAPGGLEARDVLLSVDDKTSAFDAFFIQSIKQTKRELSCVGAGHQPNATKKVRKRKYVKRIVKELDSSSQESAARKSTYLTPDKSIRVNKPQDLFDQLLNSSSPGNKGESVTKADTFFSKLCENKPKNSYSRKTYRRKVIKKINCSSDTSSESEKENCYSKSSQNVTDIRKHEFVIEKETKKSLICPDDSINKIVNNLSLLNQIREIKNKNSKDLQVDENRLTNIIKSPKIQTSPLCSTPFMEKYRGKSIYNFSPIPMKLDETIKDKDRDKSVIICNEEQILSPNATEKSEVSNSRGNKNDVSYKGDVLIICNNNNLETDEILEDNYQEISNPKHSDSSNSIEDSPDINPLQGFSSQNQGLAKIQNLEKFLRNTSRNCNNEANQSPIFQVTQRSSRISLRKKNSKEKSVRKSVVEEDKSVNLSEETASVISVIEPFLGFSENTFRKDKLSIQPSLQADKTVDNSLDNSSVIEMSVENEPFLGFSENTIAKYYKIIDDINSDSDRIEETTIVDNSSAKLRKTVPSINIESSEDDFNSASDNDSIETENRSNYDTCSSINSEDTSLVKSRVPIIVMEKMNDSLFDKYYKNMPKETDEQFDTSSSEKSELNDTESKSFDEALIDVADDEQIYRDVEAVDTNTNSDLDSSIDKSSTEDDDVQKHVSFVTTRRRNVADNSILMDFDKTRASTSSSECDQTVLSNKISSNLDIIDEAHNNSVKVNDLDVFTDKRRSVSTEAVPEDEIQTNTKAASNSVSEYIRENKTEQSEHNMNADDVDIKTAIVLQPGKKWERSLSIYKRMTIMDESLLEDAELKNKGRKYRQSVISTMEMQDQGPLHNESVSSRRNTIVTKQHRSTIRLIKEPNISRISLHTTAVYDDLTGFLSEDCDDTLVDLSRLSIADEHEVTVLGKVDDPPERVTSARDYVLRRCDQTDALLFDECYPETLLKNCHKIGEGVYGEVYLYRARDGVRVMKIIPVAGDTVVNGEHQKDFNEVISEIVIAMELSALRAPIPDVERYLDERDDVKTLDLQAIGNATDVFNEVLAVRCVIGPYPGRLLDLWELYDEAKGSENDHPAALPAHQQFVVLELANAGQDLESYQFTSADQAYAVFLQIAHGLAVGEEALQFEHRDLHWGNVLVAPTEQKHATFVLRGRIVRVARRGVAATVIDYSLARLALPLPPAGRAALYNDLAQDAALFAAAGDYQFEVYRLMRERNGNEWKSFTPYTNILWLHYTADKMVSALRYSRPHTKTHRHFLAKIKAIKNRLLNYDSSVQFVLSDEF